MPHFEQPTAGDKRLFRIFLYLLPAVADSVAGIFYFVGPVQATLMGADPLVAGSMVTARAATLCLTSIVLARFLNSHNAAFYLFGSMAMTVGVCLLGIFAVNLPMLYLTSALSGVSLVVFAAAFQLFIKIVDVDEHKPLPRVAGSYTLSWCLGMSFGPILTGILVEAGKPASGVGPSRGWIYTYLAAAGLAVFTLCCLLWVHAKSRHAMKRHNTRRREREEALLREEILKEEAQHPDLAWLGWLMAGVGAMAVGIVNGVFPAGVTAAGMPEWLSGLAMTVMSVAMGVGGYLLAVPHNSLYSPRLALAVGVAGALGLCFCLVPAMRGWGVAEHVWPYFPAAVLFGGYAGYAYLYSSYHSMAHPDLDGRNISINESFCAGGMITGSLLGGWLAKEYGFFLPFGLGAVFVFALAIYQSVAHKRVRLSQ